MIEVPGGVDRAADGTPIFYVATVQQMSIRKMDGTLVSPINSYTKSTSLEFNDNVRFGDFAFNLGVLVSRDTLYGQGLVSAPGSYSGFALEPGAKYRMYTIRWRDMIQPRFGGTWILGDGERYVVRELRPLQSPSELPRPSRLVGPQLRGRVYRCCSMRRDASLHMTHILDRRARYSRPR